MIAAFSRKISRQTLLPWIAPAAVGVCLIWSYWPTLLRLVHQWSTNAQYSHGYLVPVFAVVVLWLRRRHLAKCKPGLYWWGLAILLLAGFLRLLATYMYFDFLDSYSLVVCLAGLAVLTGGAKAWHWSWPAVAFLVFMIPLPFRLEIALAYPLQRIATKASTYALQTIGFPALSEGNVILLNEVRMGIVEACSGLSMLMVFFALSTAVAYLVKRPLWEKALLVASAVPIALIANITRITITGVLHETAGSELANLVFHDLAGWLMMPFALCLLGLELRILSRLMVTPKSTKPVPLPSLVAGLPSANGSQENRNTAAKKMAKKNAAAAAPTK